MAPLLRLAVSDGVPTLSLERERCIRASSYEPRTRKGGALDWKIELIPIPVTDVDRAKDFYVEKAGFHLDHDHSVTEDLRFVQLTPPGSACSIALGKGLTESSPGSAQVQIVVADVHAARAELVERGLDPGEVQEFPWGWFVFFADPDGNRWAVQQIPPRD
jgi:predicted enzyme related to lactoylglutathione lyase